MAESAESKITVKENGPFVVTGGLRLRRKRPLTSQDGQSLTWLTDDVIDDGPAYALCRCGQSADKPYCDGSHAEQDFDGTESAPTGPMAERTDDFVGTGITVHNDESVCAHAGFCGTRARNVFTMTAETSSPAVRGEVMAMVERCPSGALSYEVDGTMVEQSLPAEIGVVPDGPLWVTGRVEITRADGQPLETRNRVTLCRCGASASKPLCDGSHGAAGFTG